MATDQPVRVAIIFGGSSSEHDVSCLTAGGVVRAIDTERFEVVGIGITPSGRWVQISATDMAAMEVAAGVLPRLDESRPTAVLVPNGGVADVATLDGDGLTDRHRIDVAFSLLHGPFGEDGTIQGMFEMYGVRYVGSGVAASAIGMDKDLMKRALTSAGLPGCRFLAVNARAWATDPEAELAAIGKLTFPLYVKPSRGGSSVGISRVTSIEEVPEAINVAQQYDPKVIVEEGFVGAREIELAVLGGRNGEPPRVSVAGEIVMHTADAFYDFDAKYLPEKQVTLQLPANVEPELLARLQDVSARTFEALGSEGLARVDLFVHEGHVYVNEINTMPGFTRLSMFPSLWAASGLGYRDLITDLVEQALERPIGLR